VPEKKKHKYNKKSGKSVIVHLSGESPAARIEMKMCSGIDLGDVIIDVNFKCEKFKGF